MCKRDEPLRFERRFNRLIVVPVFERNVRVGDVAVVAPFGHRHDGFAVTVKTNLALRCSIVAYLKPPMVHGADFVIVVWVGLRHDSPDNHTDGAEEKRLECILGGWRRTIRRGPKYVAHRCCLISGLWLGNHQIHHRWRFAGDDDGLAVAADGDVGAGGAGGEVDAAALTAVEI